MRLKRPIESAWEVVSPPELQEKSTVGRAGDFLIPSNKTLRICINGLQHPDPRSILERFIAVTTEVLQLSQTVVVK